MCTLDNAIFIKILKETTIFLTKIGGLSLKIFYYTLLGVPKYENH